MLSERVLRIFSRSSHVTSVPCKPREPGLSYEFGPFRLDVSERWLLKDGNQVPLPPKAFDTLLILVEQNGHLVKKDELMNQVWPDVAVDEGNLSQTIFLLRKALGDSARDPRYIATAARLGYRFAAPVLQTPSACTPAGTLWTTRRKAPAMAVVAVVIAAGMATWSVTRSSAPQTAHKVRSLAVLPFTPQAGQPRDEVLEAGIADALAYRLSSLRHIAVSPANSVLKYSGPGRDLTAAGRELRVDAVLDGKIQRVANRLRVTAQLVRTSDGAPLWVQTFDTEVSGIFPVQDAISRQVARALLLELMPRQEVMALRGNTENTEAYELYLKGVSFWRRRTEQAMKKSIHYFEQAIQHDPNYALARAKLATSFGVLGYQGGLPPFEAYSRVKAEVMHALQIDNTLAEAHIHLGTYYLLYEWDWRAGERELLRAIELEPRNALAHTRYAFLLETVGRIEESRVQSDLARRIDPDGVPSSQAEAKAAAEANPDFAWAHLVLGMDYLRRAEFPTAIFSLERAAIISGRTPYMLAALGCSYGMAGRKTEARKVLNELNQLAMNRYVSPFDRAMVHSGLGEREVAFEWLEKSYLERTPRLTRLRAEPWFATIASDPRFDQLVRRVGISR